MVQINSTITIFDVTYVISSHRLEVSLMIVFQFLDGLKGFQSLILMLLIELLLVLSMLLIEILMLLQQLQLSLIELLLQGGSSLFIFHVSLSLLIVQRIQLLSMLFLETVHLLVPLRQFLPLFGVLLLKLALNLLIVLHVHFSSFGCFYHLLLQLFTGIILLFQKRFLISNFSFHLVVNLQFRVKREQGCFQSLILDVSFAKVKVDLLVFISKTFKFIKFLNRRLYLG